MGIVIFILVIAAIGGAIWWNHQTAAAAQQGVTFVVPYPPSAVSEAIHRAHNEGAKATLRSMVGGIQVQSLAGGAFATSSRIGDEGEISVLRDPAGSVVSTRTLRLYVGIHPKQLSGRSGIWGMSTRMMHAFYCMVGVTPGAAKLKRWQKGLEGRITKSLARAGA